MKTQTDTPREINGYQITCAECGDIFEAEEECGDPTQEFCGEDCRNRAKEDRALRAAAPDLLTSLEEAERVIRLARLADVSQLKELQEFRNREDPVSFERDWANLDQDGSDDDARFVDPLTLGELLLCIECNLPEITSATVSAQFDELFLSKTEEARQIFDDNLPAIVARAKAERRAH